MNDGERVGRAAEARRYWGSDGRRRLRGGEGLVQGGRVPIV